jgi:hypothetical protein
VYYRAWEKKRKEGKCGSLASRFPVRPFYSSWNSGIFFFSFSFPKWKPAIKAEEINTMLSNALKKDFIKTFHLYFNHRPKKVNDILSLSIILVEPEDCLVNPDFAGTLIFRAHPFILNKGAHESPTRPP